MANSYQQTLWKGGKKPLLSTMNKIKHIELCQTSLELSAMVRWDQKHTFWQCTPSTCLAAKWNAYKEKHLIPTVIAVGHWCFWGQRSRGTTKINGTIYSTKYQEIWLFLWETVYRFYVDCSTGHTSKSTHKWLNKNNNHVLQWPS